MSRSSEIRNIIIQLLKDGETHTSKEIRAICLEQGVIDPDHSSIVRTVVSKLKRDNPNFIVVGHGKYQLTTPATHSEAEDDAEFYKSLKYIERKVSSLKEFNWLTCTEQQLHLARKHLISLKKLANSIHTISILDK